MMRSALPPLSAALALMMTLLSATQVPVDGAGGATEEVEVFVPEGASMDLRLLVVVCCCLGV